MENAIRERAPMHLWIVGGLSTLWSAFGCYDYLMTRLRNTDYIAGMMPGIDPQEVLNWVDGFPIWASFGWGLGVWMGLLGSVLLLLRNRWAVPAFGLSLIGALLGLGYQIVGAPELPGMPHSTAMDAMPYIIIGIALALFLYARAMSSKGALK